MKHENWNKILQSCITSSRDLCQRLQIDSSVFDLDKLDFPVRVPIPYFNRIEPQNPHDPLLLQVIAQRSERVSSALFNQDPVNEQNQSPLPGLIHKYPGRVLLIMSGACAINCRYCFRRHYPYPDNQASLNWSAIHDYIDTHNIHEVILSGGDPLMLSDALLRCYIERIAVMSSVTTLRIHTRLPVVIPARITTEFIQLLTDTRLNTVTVLHSNHPNEIDPELSQTLQKLSSATTLLNQSVLLKNINDSAETLIKLSHRLWQCGVLPYYLHQLDPVEGAEHFLVKRETGHKIIQSMRDALPGYLVPRYASEIPGRLCKTILS